MKTRSNTMNWKVFIKQIPIQTTPFDATETETPSNRETSRILIIESGKVRHQKIFPSISSGMAEVKRNCYNSSDWNLY